MNKLCNSVFCAGVALALSVFPDKAGAQEPGTNVATPPPTQTPLALRSPADAATEPAPTATVIGNSSNEPVIDATTRRSTFPNKPLLLTGTLILGASYGASAIVAATSDRSADDKLYYPVVGPWLDLQHRGCADVACDNKTRDRVLLVGSGVLQGIGALGMVLSLVVPERTTRRWYLIGNNDVVVVPSYSASSMGLAAAGRF